MTLLWIILACVNLTLGLYHACQGKQGNCVLNAIAFGACLYMVLKGLGI